MNLFAKPVAIERLKFDQASFRYDHSPVFTDLTFDVPMNKNVFITGSGGGGQSTFLKLLAVLLQPNSGKYFINGEDTTEMSFEEFLPLRMRIGYSFDYGGLFANRTLHDNLTLPLLFHKTMDADDADAFVAQLAADFNFDRQRHQRPASVSGGLRKLVCVLRSFILSPEMIVMDDPFTGIGMDASRKLVRLMQDRRESGALKHVFLTCRDEVWPHWIGCDSLFVDDGCVRFEERKAS